VRVSSERVQYRTVLVDPPWEMPTRGGYSWREGRRSGVSRELDYPLMHLEAIKAIGVQSVVADDAHLWLWATNKHLRNAYDVAEAWGFRVAVPLVWSKAPRGFNPGGDFGSVAEFLLYCKRGEPKAKRKVEQQVFTWPRVGGADGHSTKPPGSFELIESVSHWPYLELFQREGRIGWDGAGHGAVSTVDVPGVENIAA
jgi:N6-adenosine-specific RNA methylase IME4